MRHTRLARLHVFKDAKDEGARAEADRGETNEKAGCAWPGPQFLYREIISRWLKFSFSFLRLGNRGLDRAMRLELGSRGLALTLK